METRERRPVAGSGFIATRTTTFVGRRGFELLREMSEPLCDLDVDDAQQAERFSSTYTDYAVGSALLVEGRTTASDMHRRAVHVARAGIDMVQLHLNLQGQTLNHWQPWRPAHALFAAGSIGVLETVRPTATRIGAGGAHFLTLFLPRPLLQPLLRQPDPHGCLIGGSQSAGNRLARLMLELRVQLRGGAASRAEQLVADIAALAADALGGSSSGEETIRAARRRSTVAAIKRYIDAHLEHTDLQEKVLGAGFGISRATAYRLFEADGGLVNYIQRRRLRRALILLMTPARGRILDIALDSSFASDATFSRAFRRCYGATPGELRLLARERQRALQTGESSERLHWLPPLQSLLVETGAPLEQERRPARGEYRTSVKN